MSPCVMNHTTRESHELKRPPLPLYYQLAGSRTATDPQGEFAKRIHRMIALGLDVDEEEEAVAPSTSTETLQRLHVDTPASETACSVSGLILLQGTFT